MPSAEVHENNTGSSAAVQTARPRCLIPSRSQSALIMVGVTAAAFVLFAGIGAGDHLFRGHDHWLSGQAMLLAKAYAAHGHQTPLGLMFENPDGHDLGWAPYTGWPPLFFAVLGGLIRLCGESLVLARLLSAVAMALAAGLTAEIAFRVGGRSAVAGVAALAFCANRIVTNYCTLVFCDVPALAWILLFVRLYPAYVVSRSRLNEVAMWTLAAVGCLLSWQCYVAVPVCACLALVVWPECRSGRAALRLGIPVVLCGVAGTTLLVAARRVERLFVQNAWYPPESSSLAGKFVQRSVFGAPQAAFEHIGNFVYLVGVFASTLLLSVLAWQVLTWAVAWWQRHEALTWGCPAPVAKAESQFLFGALWLVPLAWLLAMPEMHEHDFQAILWAPAIATTAAWMVAGGAVSTRRVALAAWGPQAGLAVLLIWAICWHVGKKQTGDDAKMAGIQRAVQSLSPAGMPVVLDASLPDRGLWWRLHRPVIGWNRLAVVRNIDHLFVAAFDPKRNTSWTADYDIIANSVSSLRPYDGFTVFRSKPRPATTSP